MGATGLMWTKADSHDSVEFPEVLSIPHNDAEEGAMLWEDALSFCENLDYAGYIDWKLPDIKELHTIFYNPEEEDLPAIDTDFFDISEVEFPDYCNGGTFTSYPFFWGSTTHREYNPATGTAGYGNKATYIAFGKSWGYVGYQWVDAHAPGAQRSDPKTGNPANYDCGLGPQGDYISIFNAVRCVRLNNSAALGSE
ncbi:MAG: DUF1566 domain-containing protein [Desulfobacteraceae bacterium]|nr:DUF1566 domain-containing protein [Desulfobacteraceae bacterium]